MSRQQPQLHSYLWRCTAYSLQQGISQHLLCWISWPSGKQLPQQEQQDSLTSGGVCACASEQHNTARHLRALSGLISSTDKQALLVRQSTAQCSVAAAGTEMICSEEPQVRHWAVQNAPGIVTELTGPQEESFLGEWGLESLASNWFIKFAILDSVSQSCCISKSERLREGSWSRS